jgi:membrane protease YdiL (CAAX protease family)
VVAVTLLVGGTLLGISLATEPGERRFYPLLLALAAVWIVGALASGPVPFRAGIGRVRWGECGRPIAIGLAVGAAFLVGGLVIHEIDPLRDYATDVFDHARRGNTALVWLLALANGVGEEMFFRGALYAAAARHRPLLVSTVVYVAVTAGTGNPLLVLAAVLMGAIFAAQRAVTGGVLAPMLTHLTWSLVVLAALPSIID